MTAEQAYAAVLAAKQYVLQHIPLSNSDNKNIKREMDNRSIEERLNDQSLKKKTVDQTRLQGSAPLSAGLGVTKALKYGEYALQKGYGNCLEMACAAASFLNNRGDFDWDLVYYSETPQLNQGVIDHIFVALNQPGGHGVGYPNFAQWSPSAAICDVWADIACLAQEYPQKWRDQMQSWNFNGMLIANQLPTEPMWKDVVDKVKSSYIRG
jgi:hypothetical protein